MEPRWAAIPIAVGLLAVLVAAPGPVRAECSATDPWPSFRELAPSAQRVVIGTVVESLGPRPRGFLSEFRLRIDETLRGPAARSMDLRHVQSGDVLTICPSDSQLRVHLGDVIALATGGRLGSRSGITTVAWVLDGPGRPDAFLMPGVETLARGQIRAIVALPATDTRGGTARSSRSLDQWTTCALLAIVAFLLVVLPARRSTRRADRLSPRAD